VINAHNILHNENVLSSLNDLMAAQQKAHREPVFSVIRWSDWL
jgi:hypothetical protein